MNHLPKRRRLSSDATVLVLFLGVAALAAGLSALMVPGRPSPGTPMKPEDAPVSFQDAVHEAELKDARDKASQVQQELAMSKALPIHEAAPGLDPPVPGPAAIPAAIPAAPPRPRRIPVKVLDEAIPPYPRAAQSARIQGAVEVRVLVDTQGRPARTRVLSGPAPLRGEAVAAAQHWRFSPARRNGKPVDAPYLLRFDFRLA